MDEALQRLEAVRRATVERAQLALSEAQRVHAQAFEVRREACARQLSLEQAVASARATFARADSVLALRSAEQQLRSRSQAAELAARRAVALSATVHAAEQRLAGCREQLRRAEVERRAVARNLERRAADVSRRTELRAEAERDELYRAVHSPRAGGDFPRR